MIPAIALSIATFSMDSFPVEDPASERIWVSTPPPIGKSDKAAPFAARIPNAFNGEVPATCCHRVRMTSNHKV